MSGDVQIELWLHEYKLNALAAVLEKEGITVEQRMQDALTELYVAQVPPETRKEISARIKEELAAREAEIEESRKCAGGWPGGVFPAGSKSGAAVYRERSAAVSAAGTGDERRLLFGTVPQAGSNYARRV